MTSPSVIESSSSNQRNGQRQPIVVPADSPNPSSPQIDSNEVANPSKWKEYNVYMQQLENNFAKNCAKATMKEIDIDRDRKLRLVEMKRQRRIQQTEQSFEAQEAELLQEFEAANARLKIAWEALYPSAPGARKRQRKRYPRSLKELTARLAITRRDEDEIKQNLEELYESPDDTPELQKTPSASPNLLRSTPQSLTRKSTPSSPFQ
ncbi:hypothetical protein BDA99DRAFT_561709 [Phascolomyces articulosus]|uniref:Uncharacterized protein n=1 Tax=Phascolomyces articulosus TaxID=60185 RepID=A0AAD5JVZ0_9FUNG|nr:hypothetical protein BDA99DRAFT_561709 [Phascolomyces articulosus]